MFKKRSLGVKIISGFLLVTALVAVAGGVGYRGVRIVGEALHVVGDEGAPVVDMANEMKKALMVTRNSMEEFRGATAALATDNEQELDGIVKTYEKSLADYDTFSEAILEGKTLEDGTQVIKTDNNELAGLTREANAIHDKEVQVAAAGLMVQGRQLLKEAAEARAAMEGLEKVYDEVVSDSKAVVRMVSTEIANRATDANVGDEAKAILREEVPLADMANEIKTTLAETRIPLEEFIQKRVPAELDTLEKKYKDGIARFDMLVAAVLSGGKVEGQQIVATDNDQIRAAVQEMDTNHTEFQKQAEQLMSAHREAVSQAAKTEEAMASLDTAGEKADLLLDKVETVASVEMAAAKTEGNAAQQSATVVLITVVSVSIVLGLLIGVLLSRSITKPLNRIISGLNEGAEQVNDAAGQVATASQELAEGASEQASSLEETSSALEQMAAMTRTNAGNSKEANELAGQAQKAAAEGDKTMHQLNAAMTGINESSEKISKIIKVIEEIAFQTNLLALNAAVEAARAGDHGKGFAVVADEVRNLAQRAAQAARETTGLIEDSVNRAEQGTQVAGEVAKSLGAIVADVSKVTELIAGISQASQEQAQGVDQVNTAVSQMDKVTQQNAAGAEESASAAEQLSAQAASVKAIVDELGAIVSGAKGRGESSAVRTQPGGFVAGKAKRRLGETVAGLRNKSPLKRASAARAPADAAPSKGRHAAADKSGEGVSEDFLALDNDKAIAEF